MAGRRAVAGVAALIAMAAGMLALAGPATGHGGTPGPGTPFPQVPCDVEPRMIEELAAIEASATPLPDTYPPTIYIGELPTGVPADPETVAGVTRTMQLLVSCHLAGDGLRLAALFTDDLLQIVAGLEGPSLLESATPMPSPNRDEYLAAVEEVQLLPDGRVSAIVTRGGVDDPHPAPGRTVLMIFAKQDGRWLIDGIYERVWSGEPDMYPVYIADAVATPDHATPTPRS